MNYLYKVSEHFSLSPSTVTFESKVVGIQLKKIFLNPFAFGVLTIIAETFIII